MGTRSNRDGIGTLVKVTAGNLTQYDRIRTGGSFLSSSDMRLHFGLGDRTQVDSVEVNWPSGVVDRLKDIHANQVLVVREGKGQVPSNYRPLKTHL